MSASYSPEPPTMLGYRTKGNDDFSSADLQIEEGGILNDPGGSSGVTSVLKSWGGTQKREPERWLAVGVGLGWRRLRLEMEEFRDHQPRKEGGLQKLEKTKIWIVQEGTQPC